MDAGRIAALVAPFVPAPLDSAQLAAVSAYLDLLVRWNQRLNLTAVRDPEEMVRRHFGESLFTAARLLPDPAVSLHAADVGSGAGFPGLPMKIYAPSLRLTLIESQQKKATFLREVIRALHLADVEVFAGRAESFSGKADVVTLRAVERFERAVPVAARLLSARSRLALLIGATQVDTARRLLPGLRWSAAVPIPESSARVLLVGEQGAEKQVLRG